MAKQTPNKAAAKTPVSAPAVDPRGSAPVADSSADKSSDEPQPRSKKRVVEDEAVTVAVPKAFKLLTEAGTHDYPAGIYEMPRSHAEHWYAQHFGVEIKE